MADSDHVFGYSPSLKDDLSNSSLYGLVQNYLSTGYAVIYSAESIVSSPRETEEEERGATIAEQNMQEKTYAVLLDNLARHIGANKIKRYLQRGLLTVIDPDSIFPANASIKQLLKSMNSHIENCEARVPQDIEGKVLFNSPGNFFQADKFDKFLEFENTLGKRFDDDSLQMICWYKRRWIQNLSFSQLVHLLTAHNQSIHDNVQFQAWDIDRTIQVISRGINEALEQDRAAEVIFETMQRRFNLNRSTIVSSPNLFEDTLKMMSPDSAMSIINAVKGDFENKLSFDNKNKNNRGITRNFTPQKRKRGEPRSRTSSRTRFEKKKHKKDDGRTNNKRHFSK